MDSKKVTKFNYETYTVKTQNERTEVFTETFNTRNSKKICICGNFNQNKCFQCFKCTEKVHNCVKAQLNRPQIHSFQCLSCLARSLDLVFQPNAILLETFYRIQNIFQKQNLIHFQFNLKFEQTKFPVQVRSLKGSKIELIWPMQGQYFLNGDKNSILALKPLKTNSNRKNRKQDNLMITPELLKEGKNILTFRIPHLDRAKFVQKFQFEQQGVFFMGIYSVKELTDNQILNLTLRQRRHQKMKTLSLLKEQDNEFKTQTQKIKLIDPYTCEKIRYPVRGKYCTHLKAVCLITYIGFQKHSRSWKCPICSHQKNMFMNEPYIDLWLLQILKESNSGESVYIHENGTHEWQRIQRKVESLDSSNEDNDMVHELIQEGNEGFNSSLIPELSNFNIDQSQRDRNQAEKINLIDYSQQGVQQSQFRDFWNQNQGDCQVVNTVQIEDQQTPIVLQNELNKDPIMQEARQNYNQEDSNDQFQFPFENNFVPSQKLQNVLIQKIEPAKLQLSVKNRQPQIYKSVIKQYPQTNAPIQSSSAAIQKVTQAFKNQPVQKIKSFIASKFNKNKINVSSESNSKIKDENTKLIGNKRLIQRPTYLQIMEAASKHKQSQLGEFPRVSSESFGKIKHKNIEFNQQKNSKSALRFQNAPASPANILTGVKVLKKQEKISKQVKSKKIKLLKFESISHSKFRKHFCNIPLNPLERKMNNDIKRLFKNIL